MNATRRWAYHFVTNLECLSCRRTQQRKLFTYDGIEIVSEKHTIAELKAMLPNLDVWCVDCTPSPILSKTRRDNRLQRKQDAALLADIFSRGDWRAKYDTITETENFLE